MSIPLIKPTDPKLTYGAGFWYLASPYAKYEAGHEAAWFDVCNITLQLMRHNVRVFSPIAHSHSVAVCGELTSEEKGNHDFWMPNDLALLYRSDGVLVAPMNGWEESKGVNMEIDYAHDHDKDVYLLDLN